MLIRTGFPSNKYSRDTTECETDLVSANNTEKSVYVMCRPFNSNYILCANYWIFRISNNLCLFWRCLPTIIALHLKWQQYFGFVSSNNKSKQTLLKFERSTRQSLSYSTWRCNNCEQRMITVFVFFLLINQAIYGLKTLSFENLKYVDKKNKNYFESNFTAKVSRERFPIVCIYWFLTYNHCW